MDPPEKIAWPCGHLATPTCSVCIGELLEQNADLIAKNEHLRAMLSAAHHPPPGMPAHGLNDETNLSAGVSAWADDAGRVWLHSMNGDNQAIGLDAATYNKFVGFIAAMQAPPGSPWASIATGLKGIFDFFGAS